MSWNVVSKNNSNISGTTSNRTKLTGDENTLDVKAKKDLWISGDDNDGKVRLQGDARLAITGSYNDLNSVDASSATNGSVLLNGSNNRVRSYTGSNSNNNVSLRGSNNRLDSAVFGKRADRLTSINGTIGSANMGSGNDFVGIKNAQDKFTLNGGAGTDKLWLDKIDDKVDGSSISNFEQLYLKEFNSDYQVKKGTDGRYYVENNGNKLTLGTNDIDIWDGTKYTKASVLAGATGSTGGTGSTGSTGATGQINQGDFDAGDPNDINARDKKINDINLGLENDTLRVNKNSEGTADGGGGSDTVRLDDVLAKYKIEETTDGYKLTHNDTNKILNLNGFENFNFAGIQSITAADLKNWVAPVYGDGADVANIDKAANAVTAIQNLLGGNDVINYKAGATGYTFNGGSGADLFNAFDYQNYADDAALKTALANSSASQIQFGGSKINSDVENFKFNVGGVEKAFTWGQLLAFLGL